MKSKFLLILCVFSAAAALCGFELIKGGKLQLDGIVLRAKPTPSESRAAEELRWHLAKAADRKLPLITESKCVSGKKYIFVGNCRANLKKGMDPAEMARNSGVIFIADSGIHISGKDWNKNYLQWNNSTGTLFAACEFLEKFLGVRWLWPGDTGTYVPVRKNLILPNGRSEFTPKTKSSLWRNVKGIVSGWNKEANRKKFVLEQGQWLKRHRFSCDGSYQMGHAFTRYYRLYGKSNPEFFSFLPDGTRRPNPFSWSKGAPNCVTMCVTNPSLVRQIIDNWKNRTPRAKRINLNENDSSGECVCKTCLAADNSPVPDSQRLARAKKLFAAKKSTWVRELGSVSDRYCKFYLDVQKEADKIDPGHEIMGLIYANYSQVPSPGIKLNDRIILRFCPPSMYPWTKESIARYKKLAGGWAKTGAKLMFRPNFTLSGSYFPVQYQDVFYDLYTFAAKDIVAVDMDSLTGHYAVQGLVNYVIASLNHDRKASLDKRKDDFYTAFGTAKPYVKQYFDYITRVSMHSTILEQGSWLPEGGSLYLNMFTVADRLFTPQVMAKCDKILTAAAKAPGLDPAAARRVQFLRDGLKNVELTMAAQAEFRKHKKGAPITKFALAVQKLDAFRNSIEHTNAFNMGNIRFLENRHWPMRDALALIGTDAVELDNWKILFDPRNAGLKEKWYLPAFDMKGAQAVGTNSHWAKQPVGKAWKKKHGIDYLGVGWYFHRFPSPVKKGVKKVEMLFQSVDGSAVIYLNGKEICNRPYPYKGNTQSWREPFRIELPLPLLKKENNFLAIRIEKHIGLAGIWRSVNMIPVK